jgi:hypothetical protein
LTGGGAHVRVGSRQRERAEGVCERIRKKAPKAQVEPAGTGQPEELQAALTGRNVVVAAGAAGAVLLPQKNRLANKDLKVVVDLNAVPPLGIEGVEVTDKALPREGAFCYGAIGVGDTKMKVHKAAIVQLFESNDQVMDAEEVYALAAALP